jgi:hypothetical protein
MQAARDDAERIVKALHAEGISKARIARLFGCNPRTIARILTPIELVQEIPYGGNEVMAIQLLERFEQQDRTLDAILDTLAVITQALLDERQPVYDDAVHRFDALLTSPYLKEAA